MITAKVHKKYLVVVPKDVRKKLGVEVGDIIEFKIEDDRVILVPRLRGRTEEVLDSYGSVKFKGEIDKTMESGYRKIGAETIEPRNG